MLVTVRFSPFEWKLRELIVALRAFHSQCCLRKTLLANGSTALLAPLSGKASGVCAKRNSGIA